VTRPSGPFLALPTSARLHGELWTGDGPPVVLLHAGVADRRSWYAVADGLAGREVVAYDRRGCGESPVSAEAFSHVDDLVAVLDEIAPEPAWLVGSSMGGGLAIDTALSMPDRVAGLVLLAPAVSGAPEPEIDFATEALGAALDAAYESGDLDEVNRLEAWIWLDGPAGPEGRVAGAPRDLFFVMNRILLDNGVAEDAGKSGVDAWERLGELRVPTMIACGDLDVPFLVERCRQLADTMPNARLVDLPGLAHLPYLEDPMAVVDLVQAALAAES
jgi:pimeloyl-ACP methyl ester carboxylesterase